MGIGSRVVEEEGRKITEGWSREMAGGNGGRPASGMVEGEGDRREGGAGEDIEEYNGR